MNTSYIVLDLEWNQGYEKTTKPEMPFEIIEIGAVKLDSERRAVDAFECSIRPRVYRTLHHMVKKVIRLKMEELRGAEPFPIVMKRFLKWCGRDYIFCTWGPQDLGELQRNMRYYGMKPLANGPLAFLDVQKLFSLDREDGKIRRSLESAVEMMDIEKGESFHRADSDAGYTAEILRIIGTEALEKHVSYDLFHLPPDRRHELKVRFDTYSKYVSREFPDKADALRDSEAKSLRCFVCNKDTKTAMDWFTLNGRNYLGLGVCKEHGPMRGKLRLRKSDGGKHYVVKTIRPATREDEKTLKEQQQKAEQAEKKRELARKAEA